MNEMLPYGSKKLMLVSGRAFPALADGCLYARSKDKLICVSLKN